MIRSGLVKFTSIEAIADELVKEGDNVIARGLDITGLGLVKTPGIPEMTIAIAEAFDDESEDSEVEEKGDLMTEQETKEKKQEETKETNETKETKETNKETETDVKETNVKSLIDKSMEKITKEFESKESELKKEVDVLKENIKKLQEQPTKGKVTEESNYPKLTKSLNKDGTKDIYSESFLY